MNKLLDFIQFLNENTTLNIIWQQQGFKPPNKPFITVQAIDIDMDTGLKRWNNGTLQPDDTFTQTKGLRTQTILQFDSYSDNIENTFSLIKELVGTIDFKLREEINEIGYGIIEIGTILNNTSFENNSKYIYRNTCDITIDYVEEFDKLLYNANKTTITTNDDDTFIVEREG